jgi:hypothetical protein
VLLFWIRSHLQGAHPVLFLLSWCLTFCHWQQFIDPPPADNCPLVPTSSQTSSPVAQPIRPPTATPTAFPTRFRSTFKPTFSTSELSYPPTHQESNTPRPPHPSQDSGDTGDSSSYSKSYDYNDTTGVDDDDDDGDDDDGGAYRYDDDDDDEDDDNGGDWTDDWYTTGTGYYVDESDKALRRMMNKNLKQANGGQRKK